MGSDLPGVFKSLESALSDYGYLAIVLLVGVESFGVPAPGQTVLVAAGVYAGAGRLDRIEEFFGRHGGKVVPVARFVDGLRQFNGVAAGLANMPAQRFLAANAAGAALWVAVCVTVGFLAGNHIGAVYETIKNYQLYLLVAVGLLALGLVVRWLWRSRRPA